VESLRSLLDGEVVEMNGPQGFIVALMRLLGVKKELFCIRD
jgi:hypothetical protein